MKIFKRLLGIIASAFMCLSMLLPVQSTYASAASAKSLDDTSVEEDFRTSGFDVTGYRMNLNGSADVVNFMEYCYSDKNSLESLYGLYLYVYNPTCRPVETLSSFHKANMAVEYDVDGEILSCENVSIVYVNHTSDGLFYKFKVLDSSRFLTLAHNYAYKFIGQRRYDVAGIQIDYADQGLAEDFDVSKSYIWTGYAAGCGVNDNNTLSCKVTGLDTLNINVHTSTWRSSELLTNEAVTTAYFSIPQKYKEDYLKLQKIKAEWYEYKTDYIFATTDEEGFSEIYDWIGKESTDELRWRIFFEELYTITPGLLPDITTYFGSCYNLQEDDSFPWGVAVLDEYGTLVYQLDWLFKIPEGEQDDYRISSERMKSYMNWYTSQHPEQDRVIGRYSKELFVDDIDEDRKKFLTEEGATAGHCLYEFDVDDDKFDLRYDVEGVFWKWLFGQDTVDTRTYMPFVLLDESIKDMTVAEFEEEYIVSDWNTDSDSGSVYEDCIAMLDAGTVPVLFRFARTDYYNSPCRVDDVDGSGLSPEDGYVSQETVFLNFDVISLSFLNNDGETLTVVPVVSNPIDVIAGLELMEDVNLNKDSLIEFPEFDYTALLIVGILIGVVIIFFPKVFDAIVKVLVWIICLPFNLLEKLIRRLRK